MIDSRDCVPRFKPRNLSNCWKLHAFSSASFVNFKMGSCSSKWVWNPAGHPSFQSQNEKIPTVTITDAFHPFWLTLAQGFRRCICDCWEPALVSKTEESKTRKCRYLERTNTFFNRLCPDLTLSWDWKEMVPLPWEPAQHSSNDKNSWLKARCPNFLNVAITHVGLLHQFCHWVFMASEQAAGKTWCDGNSQSLCHMVPMVMVPLGLALCCLVGVCKVDHRLLVSGLLSSWSLLLSLP